MPDTAERSFVSDPDTAALYHLDEAAGAVAHDASRYHDDAALRSGAVFASPPVCR